MSYSTRKNKRDLLSKALKVGRVMNHLFDLLQDLNYDLPLGHRDLGLKIISLTKNVDIEKFQEDLDNIIKEIVNTEKF